MLEIGKPYLNFQKGKIRFCADIMADERRFTLWFAVGCSRAKYFVPGRSDAFLMALLPYAMAGGHEVRCAGAISERLCYQLNHYLIPALSSAGAEYRLIAIDAPLVREACQNRGEVGAAFSGSVDALYTIMSHDRECECPLTHIVVLNAGIFEGKEGRKEIRERLWQARGVARRRNLAVVRVDTNLQEELTEDLCRVYPFREIACALALQGLFSVYLLSSGYDVSHFRMKGEEAAAFNLLTAGCASTESLTFYPSGVEQKRWKKREALDKWPKVKRLLRVNERDVPAPSDALTYEERVRRKRAESLQTGEKE